MQTIRPNFMVEGGSQAFLAEADDPTRFRLFSVLEEGGEIWADPEDIPYFRALSSLGALFTEVAIDNDLEGEIRVDKGTGRHESSDRVSPITAAWNKLLQGGMSHPKEWTVSVAGTALAFHDQERERLWGIYEDQNGGDRFDGERRLLSLLERGTCPVVIRAGDKVLRYDTANGRYFFEGSTVWTAEEMATMALWILSDEAIEQPCPEQYGPFLVQPLRGAREELDEAALVSAQSAAETSTSAASSSSTPPATEAPEGSGDPTAGGDIESEAVEPQGSDSSSTEVPPSAAPEEDREPDPLVAQVTAGASVLQRVIAAGEVAEGAESDDEERVPLDVSRAEAQRDRYLRRHKLVQS